MIRNPLSQAVINSLQGSKGGGSARKAVESPDTLRSIASADIVDLISEGEIEGFPAGRTNFLRNVFFDETPVENVDGTHNFKNFRVEFRTGTQDQEHIPGFGSVGNEIAIGVELIYGTPWVRSVTNQELDAVRVRVGVSALSSTNQENGDITGHRVQYAIDLAVGGGAFTEYLVAEFVGKTNGPYERSHRIDLPPYVTGGWTIRVRRLTLQAGTAYIQDTTFVQSFTEIIDGKFRYPMSAVAGVSVDASQFQRIPTRSYLLRGRRIQVPTNYDPETRTYATTGPGTSGGTWDGTFKSAYSNNPAWCFYDLATHKRYGLGHLVSPLLVDKWNLYAIGQYCDETVPDGFGGTEPRMTCNLYLQSGADAYKVLFDLASIFRGICYWAAGSIVPVADRPSDPVYTYTNSNVVGGIFKYEGSSRRARHTAVMIGYNDMTNFGKIAYDYYDDDEAVARYGFQLTTIVAMGTTSRGQAQRVAKWLLLSEKLLTNTVAFAVGRDGTYALPGQIVRVADQFRAGRRIGGRVGAGSTASSVVLDAIGTPAPAIGDDLTIILPTGISETRTIGAITGTTITPSTSFSAAPAPQSVWAVDSNDLNTQLFKVLAVAKQDDGTYALHCLQHNPTLFDAVDLGAPITVPPTSVNPAPNQARPASVTIQAVDRRTQNLNTPLLIASWPAAPGAIGYRVQWRRDSGQWTAPQDVTGTSTEYNSPFPGEYEVLVSAYNAIGVTSVPRQSAIFTMGDPLQYPGYVDDLNAGIDNALATAQNAEAIADGAVESFWQPTPPVIGSGAGEASEGDLWFDTDDGNHIWRVVGGVWVSAQDDQLAQALLAASTAQATADGKVKTYFASTAPIHNPPTVILNLGDLWFNTTVGVRKLFRWNGSNWNDVVSDVTMDQLAGLGTNLMPDEYSVWDSTDLPTFSALNTVTLSRDAAQRYVGSASLKYVTSGADSYAHWYPAAAHNIKVTPGRKYIFSIYARASVSATPLEFRLFDSVGAFAYATAVSGAADTWTRVSVVFDMTASASTAVGLRIDVDASGRTVYFDGAMLEYQLGTLTTPSPYSRGMGSGLALRALAAAATAQATADGAVYIWRQPTAPTFPPAAVGDYWIDTTGGTNKPYYSSDGATWTDVTDQRVIQALADAAAAQTTANGRIKTWYQTTQPVAATVGDMWFNPDTSILTRWDGAAWVNTADNSLFAVNPYVANPSFEQGLTNWLQFTGSENNWGTVSGSGPTAPHTGTKFLQKSGGSTGTQGYANDMMIPCKPGDSLAIRAVVRCETGVATGYMTFGFAYYNDAGQYVGTDVQGATPEITAAQAGAGGWKHVTAARQVPVGATKARAAFNLLGYAGSGAWWVDTVDAFPLEAATSGGNMLINPDFVRGLGTPWFNITGILNGALPESYFVTTGALGEGVAVYPYQDVSNDITTDQKYSAQVEIAPFGASGIMEIYLYLQCLNAGLGVLSTTVSQVLSTANHQPSQYSRLLVHGVQPPAGTVTMRWGLSIRGTLSQVRWRKPKLERGPYATAWQPGIDATWGARLATPGSGQTVGDQRNLVQSNVNSYGSVRSTAALTARNVAGVGHIDVNSHIAYWGGSSATYNAVTDAITGLTPDVRYVVYCSDAGFAGGTKTWLTAASPTAVMQLGDDKYIAGEVTIPATAGGSGSGGSGGGGGGGGEDWCVVETMVLPDGKLAYEVRENDLVLCWDYDLLRPGVVDVRCRSNVQVESQPCIRVVSKCGASVAASESTPMTLRNGTTVLIGDMEGEEVLVRLADGTMFWDEVTELHYIGHRTVSKIKVDNHCYFAGYTEQATIATHNPFYKP